MTFASSSATLRSQIIGAGSGLWGYIGIGISPSLSSLARAVIRIRVREGVVRVDVAETAIRAVIRIAAPKQQAHPHLPTESLRFRFTLPLRKILFAFSLFRESTREVRVCFFDGCVRMSMFYFGLSCFRESDFTVRQPSALFRRQRSGGHNKQGESRKPHASTRRRCPRGRSRDRNTSRYSQRRPKAAVALYYWHIHSHTNKNCFLRQVQWQ